MSKHADTIIAVTTGKQDRGTRATLAFAWGCAALAMGQSVTIFLTMEGTIWSAIGAGKDVSVAGFESLEAYMEQFTSLGGELLVCGPCTEYYCSLDRDRIQDALVADAQLSGLATIVARTGRHTNVITF